MWSEQTLSVVGDVIERVRAGRPTVLQIEGDAGAGKSTLLDEVELRASGFKVQRTEARLGDSLPYGSLAGWGVTVGKTASGDVQEPFFAANQLRGVLDRLAGHPVLLRLDDLQWADPESVLAVLAVMQRAAGDRLLVVTATRPLEQRHSAWRRWLATAEDAVVLPLPGLTEAEAVSLARQRHPLLDEVAIGTLWAHTSGNPLYLTALLAEHDAEELSRSRVLPAPAEFAYDTYRRLRRLPAGCVSLMQASATLGAGWSALFDAADIAQVDDADAAAQLLADAGLLRLREVDGAIQISATHALVQAAVYHQIPLPQRRQLHAKAANVMTDPGTALENRLAAAARYDPALAEDLAAHAWTVYREGSHRAAATFLRGASSMTADRGLRERRWLDSVLLSILAWDSASVAADLPAVRGSSDRRRRALVLGAHEVLSGRWNAAEKHLAAVSGTGTDPAVVVDPSDPDERLVLYRIELLLAWVRAWALPVGSDERADAAVILDGIARAAALGVTDKAVEAYGMYATSVARARLAGVEQVLAAMPPLPAEPELVPTDSIYLLLWRGGMRTVAGWLVEAKADLEVGLRRNRSANRRLPEGGLTRSFLGFVQWLLGEWDLAQVTFRMAVDVSLNFTAPTAMSYVSLAASGRGDFAEADSWLERADQAVAELPAPEALQCLLVARVVRLHAGGTQAQRAALLPSMRRALPYAGLTTGAVGPPLLMHAALASIWAGELSEAEALLARIERPGRRPVWTTPVVNWLRGLIAEAKHESAAAVRLLRVAVAGDAGLVPLYRAHILADQARVERLFGDRAVAAGAATAAVEQYRILGATPYVQRLSSAEQPATALPASALPATAVPANGRPAADWPRQAESATVVEPTLVLTDRERDVLTLLLKGMSYKQIAGDLFVTRSTVGFHLSNIYAKSDVTTRHELIMAVREHPGQFGLTATSTGR